MKGQLIGANVFTSKKDSSQWCNLFFKVELPNSIGLTTRQLMCKLDRLPCNLEKMIDKTYFVDCQNNFASDFFEVK